MKSKLILVFIFILVISIGFFNFIDCDNYCDNGSYLYYKTLKKPLFYSIQEFEYQEYSHFEKTTTPYMIIELELPLFFEEYYFEINKTKKITENYLKNPNNKNTINLIEQYKKTNEIYLESLIEVMDFYTNEELYVGSKGMNFSYYFYQNSSSMSHLGILLEDSDYLQSYLEKGYENYKLIDEEIKYRENLFLENTKRPEISYKNVFFNKYSRKDILNETEHKFIQKKFYNRTEQYSVYKIENHCFTNSLVAGIHTFDEYSSIYPATYTDIMKTYYSYNKTIDNPAPTCSCSLSEEMIIKWLKIHNMVTYLDGKNDTDKEEDFFLKYPSTDNLEQLENHYYNEIFFNNNYRLWENYQMINSIKIQEKYLNQYMSDIQLEWNENVSQRYEETVYETSFPNIVIREYYPIIFNSLFFYSDNFITEENIFNPKTRIINNNNINISSFEVEFKKLLNSHKRDN